MSSDFERLLRDAREALPLPDEESTQRARYRAVASLRTKRRRARVLVLAGATLVGAVALGVTAGSLNAPNVTAAREPAELGFVPEPGWFALQSPPPAIQGQQIVAVAANVPFAPDDVKDGLVEPSGLPYSTLLTLPPSGIVIVATMTPETIPHVAPVRIGPYYPRVELPLRLRDALQVVHWGAQVRPDQPTAQFHLPVHLRGYNVDVVVYFGTPMPSGALMREAQRQLSGFVVRSEGSEPRGAATVAAPSETHVLLDRTFSCGTVPLGGLYQVEARGHAGDRTAGLWSRLAYAGVSTGGNGGRPDTSIPPVSSLAWISAGVPSPGTTIDETYDAFSAQTGGTIGRNTELCRPATERVALSRAGLRGGDVGRQARTVDCDAPRRVFVRLRATAAGSAALRERGRIFVATSTPIVRAELAVRTPAGKLLVYATVDQSGRARQYVAARGCEVER
ncbi:MAG TPA: hypothetical protein VEW90_01755 [Gaiellaceae bacterium]|nr:hypothetical protein [Gaiellaceae bacterium]